MKGPGRLRRGARKRWTELAEELAPPEERQANLRQNQNGGNRESGSIVVDNSSVVYPKGITEVREEKSMFSIEPVVVVIVLVMLAFIGFIAWQVSLMPDK
jgi:hypothetical protein